MKTILPYFLMCFSLVTFAQQNITLSDIWLKYKFYASSSSYNWQSDSTYLDLGKDVVLKSLLDNTKLTLVKGGTIVDSLVITDVIFWQPKEYVLLTANTERLYRHSKKSYVLKYDLKLNKVVGITNDKVFNPSLNSDKTYLAFTKQNNLFVLKLETWQEIQMTKDGEWNKVLNGRSDWVYEEEFGFTKAYQWIEGTGKIAYLKFDESDVKTYDMQIWGDDLYPTNYSYKYPKAGEQNAEVRLMVSDVNSGQEQVIYQTNSTFEYLSKIGATNQSGVFYYARMNRLQNKFELLHYNVSNGKETVVYSESSDKYVELPGGPYYYNRGFIIDSYKNGHKHLYKIENNIETNLTNGDFDVTGFEFYDEKEHCLYFTALLKNSHTQTLCLSKGKKVKQVIKSDDWLVADFSSKGSYVLITASSLEKPYRTTLYQRKGLKKIKEIANNNNIEDYIQTLDLGKKEFFTVITGKGNQIPCLKILPPNFDETKKYPVLMHCYGGPGHQVVTNQWNPFDYWYHQMLAQKGCIVVLADGRGTDGNGTDFRQASYGQFGNLEHQDQVTVANYFRRQSYVDSAKVGIWGWSYGGYLSSLCLMKSPEVFNTAIAVAPVTNWRFYDNIYTERYMGLPKDNPQGYDQNSPTSYAQNLTGNYLLIHGMADDNVHIQNAVSMQQALLRNNKQFEMFYYPDKNHGIYGGYTRYNLYQKMYLFLQENLLLD